MHILIFYYPFSLYRKYLLLSLVYHTLLVALIYPCLLSCTIQNNYIIKHLNAYQNERNKLYGVQHDIQKFMLHDCVALASQECKKDVQCETKIMIPVKNQALILASPLVYDLIQCGALHLLCDI